MPKDSVRHQRFNSSSKPGFSAYTYDAAGNMTNDGFHSYTYTLSWKNPSTGNPGFGDEARIYWDGRQIAYRAYDGTTYFDHQDWLGTERMRTNYQGQVAQKFQSLPWGDGAFGSYGGNGPVQDNLAFAGLDFDTESGTDHAQFRNYSPAQGRWLSPDPYDGSYDATNPQSLNRYAYVLNNPLSFLDPSGLDCVDTVDPDTGYTVTNCTVDGGDGGGWGSWPCQAYGLCGTNPSYSSQIPQNPPTAPSKQNVFACASEFASKYSIAGGLQALGIGKSGVGGFITNALGGNTFSGVTDLVSSLGSGSAGGHSVFYNMGQSVVAGPLQGVPGGLVGARGPLGSSAVGLASDAIAGGIHAGISVGGELTTLAGTASTVGLTGAEYATGVGEIKLGVDAGIYALGLAKCAAGK